MKKVKNQNYKVNHQVYHQINHQVNHQNQVRFSYMLYYNTNILKQTDKEETDKGPIVIELDEQINEQINIDELASRSRRNI